MAGRRFKDEQGKTRGTEGAEQKNTEVTEEMAMAVGGAETNDSRPAGAKEIQRIRGGVLRRQSRHGG